MHSRSGVLPVNAADRVGEHTPLPAYHRQNTIELSDFAISFKCGVLGKAMGERGEREREREGKEKREGSKRMTRRGICQQHMMQRQRRRQVSSSIQPQCTLYLWGVESPVASFGTVRHVCVTMLIVTDIPPAQIIAHEQDHVRRRCCTDAAISKQQHHESSIEAKHASCKHPSAGTTGGTKTNVLNFFVTVLIRGVVIDGRREPRQFWEFLGY